MNVRKAGAALVAWLAVCYASAAVSEEVYVEWAARYDGPINFQDWPFGIIIDRDRNIFVTGESWDYTEDYGSSYDYCTVKYSPQGNQLWVRRYNDTHEGADYATALVADRHGNVYVIGSSTSPDYGNDFVTIKYSPEGDILWLQRFSEGTNSSEGARHIEIDKNGDIYVMGYCIEPSTGFDFALVKYRPSGEIVWSNRYDSDGHGNDEPMAMELDQSGNIYVTGKTDRSDTGYHYLTIKYSQSGETLWTKSFSGLGHSAESPSGLAVDPAGNVIVTGESYYDNFSSDWLTVKYSPQGELLWARYYSGPGDSTDHPTALAVDGDGNIYVTGVSRGEGTSDDLVTLKYSPDGDTLWAKRFNGHLNAWDGGTAMAVDHDNNVCVAGYTRAETREDFLLLKYAPGGELLWYGRYDGPASHNDVVTAMALDQEGNAYLTGRSWTDSTYQDYSTVKFSPCNLYSPKAGDANADDSLSLSDVVSLVNHIFGRIIYSPCNTDIHDCRVYNRLCRYDWNGDQKVTLGDCIRAINYIFNKPGFWSPVTSLGCCPFP